MQVHDIMHHVDRVGICTERDILRKIVARGLDPITTKVSEIMSFPLHSISWDDSVEEASERMNELTVRRLVVVDKNTIIGVISATCIAKNMKYITARRLAT